MVGGNVKEEHILWHQDLVVMGHLADQQKFNRGQTCAACSGTTDGDIRSLLLSYPGGGHVVHTWCVLDRDNRTSD